MAVSPHRRRRLPFVRALSTAERIWVRLVAGHLASTLIVGYFLVPRYLTIDGPGPGKFWMVVEPLVACLMYIFDFPLILTVARIGAVDLVRPPLAYAIGNSILVSGVLTCAYRYTFGYGTAPLEMRGQRIRMARSARPGSPQTCRP